MAMTVLEPGQVPGAFAKAFHLMRSGRPGPVLIDLPIDVQLAEIDFDPEAYQPLPVYKPTATRGQAEKALDMLVTAERPLIVAGGGIINADACGPARRAGRDPRRARDPDPDGLGHHPRRPSARGGHGRPADRPPVRQRHHAGLGLRAGDRQPLGQSAHRRARHLPQGAALRPRRHRAHPDRSRLLPRPRDRVGRQGRARAAGGRRQGTTCRGHAADVEPAGCRNARSASGRCTARPTSRTSRSSPSASTRR